jgi:uracil-DNA glycosylase family 4
MVAKKKKDETIPILDEMKCDRCGLCKSSRKFIKPVGNIQGRLLIIGDLPEIDDETTGIAFSGPRGTLLKKYMDQVGIDVSDVYLTNTVMCMTPQTRAPKTEEYNACKPYIRWIMHNMPNLRYIIPMGMLALNACLNKKDLTNLRGSIREVNEFKYIPMLNPVSILVNPAVETIFLQDLNLVKNLINGTIEYGSYKIIDTLELFHMVMKGVEGNDVIAVDIETSNYKDEDISNILHDDVIGLSLSWKEKTGIYIPFIAEHKKIWDYDTQQYIVNTLNTALTKPGKKLVLQGGKFDTKFLKTRLGIDLTNVNYVNGVREQSYFFDTMMAAFLLDESSSHSLDFLVKDYQDLVSYDNELDNYRIYYAKANKLKKAKLSDYSMIPLNIIGKYGAMDADATLRLFHKYYQQIYDNNMQDVYFNIVMPLILTLTDMELHGIKVNVSKLNELKLLYEKKLEDGGELLKKLFNDFWADFASKLKPDIKEKLLVAMFGEKWEKLIKPDQPIDFNVGSPKQLGTFLYDILRLRPIAYTDNKDKPTYCTDVEALNKLKHPFVDALKDYRKADKEYTTYIMGYLRSKDSNDVIHATFNPDGTETGRLSCKEPNIQNVPRGSYMRKLFIARPGYSYVIADFSQIELRVEAAESQDPMLLKCFWDDDDIHDMVAREVMHKKPEDSVSKEERIIAKGINFGLIYGRSAYSLAIELKITEEEAQNYIDAYFKRFAGVVAYNNKQIALAHREKKVWTRFGRIRHLPNIDSRIDRIREGAERQAMNSPIQGCAGDCTNKAAVLVMEHMQDRGIDAHIVNHVHDELVLEVHNSQVKEGVIGIYNVMRYTAEAVLKIPVQVDVKVNDEWYEPDPKKEPEDYARVKKYAEDLGAGEDFVAKVRAEYVTPLPRKEEAHV